MKTKIIALGIILMSFVGANHVIATSTTDPFARYRQADKKAVEVTEHKLNHFADAEKLIREKLTLPLSKREQAMLNGLHFLVTFADVDKNFDYMFSDFMLLMNVLSYSDDRVHQNEVVELIIKTAFARAEKNLPQLYPREEGARWSFIRLLQPLMRHQEFREPYFQFYHENFVAIKDVAPDDKRKGFSHAIEVADYQTLFDYLVNTSFLHHYVTKEKDLLKHLPVDDFDFYRREFSSFTYLQHPVGTSQFRDLGYLVTHVILALTNYGELDVPAGEVTKRAHAYIEKSFDEVKNQLGDFDLFAEYVQSLRQLTYGDDKRIPDLENMIYDLQRSDGSWGSEQDFTTTPYTGIHPTGAALMALNQTNKKIRR